MPHDKGYTSPLVLHDPKSSAEQDVPTAPTSAEVTQKANAGSATEEAIPDTTAENVGEDVAARGATEPVVAETTEPTAAVEPSPELNEQHSKLPASLPPSSCCTAVMQYGPNLNFT